MWALFKDGKQVGEARDDAMSAAWDAMHAGGMEPAGGVPGGPIGVKLAPGYEIKEVAGTN